MKRRNTCEGIHTDALPQLRAAGKKAIQQMRGLLEKYPKEPTK